jgi:sodium transport system permease protein
MIDLRDVGTVWRKELRETLRDRRTLAVMILFPLVVYPLLSLLMAQVMAGRQAAEEARRSRVSLWGPSPADTDEVRRVLARDRGLEVTLLGPPGSPAPAYEGDALRAAKAALQAHDLDAFVLVTAAGAAASPAGASGGANPAPPRPATSVRVWYDETHDASEKARTRTETLLAAELPAGCARRYAITATSVAPEAQVGGYVLSKILPLVVVMMTMLGAFYPAIDITAGERERGTLETLLSSPVRRFDLMLGKVLAVTALAAITGTLNIASMSLTVAEGARMAGGAASLSIPWTRTLATLLTVIPAAFLWGSIMVAVGALARSFKEAQNLLTPVYFLCFAPALIATLGDFPLTGAALAIPGTNLTLLARDLMLGEATVAHVVFVILVTAAVGSLALGFAARMYDSERLLAAPDAGQLALGAWLRHLVLGDRRDPAGRGGDVDAGVRPAGARGEAMAGESARGGGRGPGPSSPDSLAAGHAGTTGLAPSAGQAIALFGLAFVLWFFAFSWLQRWRLIPGLLISQWGGFLGLVVLYARWLGRPVGVVLWLRRPGRASLLGALLIGLSAWIILGVLADKLMAPPKELIDSMRRLIHPPGGDRSFAISLLALAITPAICEEALFRGAILRGLRTRFDPFASCLLTGLLFGVLHGDVWRLLPTALLGMLLSWVALATGSIVPAMVIHACNNGALVTIGYFGWDVAAEKLPASAEALTLGAAVASFVAGVVVIARNQRPPSP